MATAILMKGLEGIVGVVLHILGARCSCRIWMQVNGMPTHVVFNVAPLLSAFHKVRASLR